MQKIFYRCLLSDGTTKIRYNIAVRTGQPDRQFLRLYFLNSRTDINKIIKTIWTYTY